jgi:hypothetical protein
MKGERWRPVVGYEGMYEVSDRGRVRGKRSPRRVMTPCPDSGGYLRVNLYRDGKRVMCLVHRLVLLAHRGRCPPGHEARHYPDARKSNNTLANLSWATKSTNNRDKHEHGTMPTKRNAKGQFA